MTIETKKCKQCGETKSVSKFYTHLRSNKKSWYITSKCKQCIYKREQEYKNGKLHDPLTAEQEDILNKIVTGWRKIV